MIFQQMQIARQISMISFNSDDLRVYSKIGLNNKHLAFQMIQLGTIKLYISFKCAKYVLCIYVIYTRKHNKQMQKIVIKYYRRYNNHVVKLQK